MSQFIRSIFDILLSVFDYILQTGGDFAVAATKSKRKSLYTADFANPRDVLVRNGGGFTISTWSNTSKESHAHMLVQGGSGSGKSTVVTIPTCLCVDDVSLVINDPGGDLFAMASAFEKKGYAILVLDCDKPESSEGFNALHKCTGDADVYKVANVLIKNALEKDADDFWAKSSENILALFMRYLIQYAEEPYRTLPNVLELVNTFTHSPERIDVLMAETSPQFLNEYKAIVAIPDRTLLSVLATAKTALSIYGTDSIRKICSFDSIDFESFRTTKTVLFLRTSAADSRLYRSVTATFFELFWNHILRTPPNPKQYPITFIIEEAATMYLSSLSSAVSLVRKHFCSIALFFQDFNQIEQLYGKYEAANILANTALRVFLPGAKPLETCKMIEGMIGKFQFEDEGVLRTRELLTAQEIRELQEILILYSNHPPILLPSIPWYKQSKLKKLMHGEPYCPPNKLPFTEPPILTLHS